MAENGVYDEGDTKEPTAQHTERASTPWISAWHDPVAGMICPTSSHLCSSDLLADNDFRLIMVDIKKRIRVYKGTSIQFEQKLMDIPVATKCFYSEVSTPSSPTLAVASGNQVFIYRYLRPYIKFTLPPMPIDALEHDIWNELLTRENPDIDGGIGKLAKIRDEGKATTQTLNFLAMVAGHPSGSAYGEKMEKLQHYKSKGALNQHSSITCMEVLKLNMDEPTATSMLVLGTEHQMVHILNSSALKVLTSVELDGVPSFMSVVGLFDVEYRITVACRNGSIYSIKNGQLLSTTIELETQAVGLVRLAKNVFVATMDQQVHSFHFKGKKNWSLVMPAPIVALCALESRSITEKAMLVSLNNGEVRCYNDKNLVSTIQIPGDYALGMVFGQYGREENALILSLKSGGIMVKMLYRNATLQAADHRAGPPPEQDIPLDVPKKTKLYVEQSARERAQAVDMHRTFQRDLCKLRLQTARAYVMLLDQGDGPVSSVGGTHLRLNSAVRGLGPEFQLELELQNIGKDAVSDITVALSTGPVYSCRKATSYVSLLVPHFLRKVCFDILCLDVEKTETVRAFLTSGGSQIPLLVASVNMPMAEPRLVE